MAAKIDFDPAHPPQIGTVIFYDGQPYELTGIEPYVRQDGVVTELMVWRMACADCGKPTTCRSPFHVSKGLSRRCQSCKAPGVRARK